MSNLTDTIRRRYDRLAPWFDALEGVLESWAFGPWRRQLWSRVGAGHWLEVGVGTGKNFPYHPADADITAIDFSLESVDSLGHGGLVKLIQARKPDSLH
ncbi:MAG: hypothetical protein EPN21_17975 [Methylococcaceae bacterium]|nr:MAG: hypothetical protein EPN21_17975 [Methylococcaceae bacterium]